MVPLTLEEKSRFVEMLSEIIPHTRGLGIEPHAIEGAELTLRLPYQAHLVGDPATVEEEGILFLLPPDDKLVGNASLPALHSGVVGAFMELAGSIHLVAKMERPVLPKVINFSLDYLRASRLRDTFARCTVARQGRQIANVSITAWQENCGTPNATARAHFLIAETENHEESTDGTLEKTGD